MQTDQECLKRILEQTKQEHCRILRQWDKRVRDLECQLALAKSKHTNGDADKQKIQQLLTELDFKDKQFEALKKNGEKVEHFVNGSIRDILRRLPRCGNDRLRLAMAYLQFAFQCAGPELVEEIAAFSVTYLVACLTPQEEQTEVLLSTRVLVLMQYVKIMFPRMADELERAETMLRTVVQKENDNA